MGILILFLKKSIMYLGDWKMAKSKKKIGILIPFIVIAVVAVIIGVYFAISNNRRNNELKLSDTNNTLNEIATETGLVDESDGSFYITLYVTAGVIIVTGVAVFIYVHKKADE